MWGWSTYSQVGRFFWKARGKTWHLVGDEEKEEGSVGRTSDLYPRGEEQLPLSACGFLSYGNWPLFCYSEIPAEVNKNGCVLLICKCYLSYLWNLIWNCVRMQDRAWCMLWLLCMLLSCLLVLAGHALWSRQRWSRHHCTSPRAELDYKGDSDFVLFSLWFCGRRNLCLGGTHCWSAHIVCLVVSFAREGEN